MDTIVTRMNTPEAINRSLVNAVEEARKGAGMSQRDLPDKAGVPLTTLHHKLRGHRPLNITELALISDALGLSLTELALRAERSLMAA